MAAEVGFAATPEETDPENIPLELVFRPGHVDASNVFTRQASDGEIDVTDPDSKPGTKAITLPATVYHSLTHSAIVPVRQNQLPCIPIPTGSLTLLYRRMII